MATNSHIVIELKDEEIGGNIQFRPELLETETKHVINNFETPSFTLEKKYMSIAHNWDSQPSKLGKILLNEFNERNKILQLMAGGNMRSIIEVIMSYTAMNGQIREPWYLNSPRFFNHEEDINFQNLRSNYIYFFKNDEWLYKKNNFTYNENQWEKLSKVLF